MFVLSFALAQDLCVSILLFFFSLCNWAPWCFAVQISFHRANDWEKKNVQKTISSSIILLTLDWAIMALCRITHGHQSFVSRYIRMTETKLTIFSSFVVRVEIKMELLGKYIIASWSFLVPCENGFTEKNEPFICRS